MRMKIAGAPCCWGVDDPQNPYLPAWQHVLQEAQQAGFKGIELGPYGYMPLDVDIVKAELDRCELTVIAGTIFDDLVAEDNLPLLLKQVDDICSLITRLDQEAPEPKQTFPTPYLVIIDWGHQDRNYAAGHPDRAVRLQPEQWQRMMNHIRQIAEKAAREYGVRAVIHPHAGGYIEFADEIEQLMHDIPHETAGLCLDTGHLAYSKMDPVEWLRKCWDRIDYLHFKDIDAEVYNRIMNTKIGFFEACAEQVMCPIGRGSIDYAAIYNLLTQECPYEGFITVEQERDPRHADGSLDDIRSSVAFLESLGFNQTESKGVNQA